MITEVKNACNEADPKLSSNNLLCNNHFSLPSIVLWSSFGTHLPIADTFGSGHVSMSTLTGLPLCIPKLKWLCIVSSDTFLMEPN